MLQVKFQVNEAMLVHQLTRGGDGKCCLTTSLPLPAGCLTLVLLLCGVVSSSLLMLNLIIQTSFQSSSIDQSVKKRQKSDSDLLCSNTC